MEQLNAYLSRLEGEEYRNALKFLVQSCPGATWEITRFPDHRGRLTLPFLKTEAGYFVEVAVTVNETRRSQMLPVLDENGEVILEGVTSLEVQIAIENCFLVCVALHGLDPHRNVERSKGQANESERGQLSSERQKEFTSQLIPSSHEQSPTIVDSVQDQAPVKATKENEPPLPLPPETHTPSSDTNDLYRFVDLEVVVDDEASGRFHFLMHATRSGRPVEIVVGPEYSEFFDQPIKDMDLFEIETEFYRNERLGEFLFAKHIAKAS